MRVTYQKAFNLTPIHLRFPNSDMQSSLHIYAKNIPLVYTLYSLMCVHAFVCLSVCVRMSVRACLCVTHRSST